jgi:amino acid permease
MSSIEIEQKDWESGRHGTILSGYSVLCKSMIGSGIFSMASAFSNFGLIPGVIALCFAAAITWLSLHVLCGLALAFRQDNPSFYIVSEKILPRARWVLDIALIINCFGAAVAYVITSGTLMAKAIVTMFSLSEVGGMGERHIAMIVQAVMILCLAPLCMLKEISATKFANLVGLSCLLYIVIVTFFYTDPSKFAGNSALLYPSSALAAMGSFPTFVFAFACQMNMFQIANEMKNANMRRLGAVSAISTATGFIVYIPMAIIPFLTFGFGVESNYLYNLDTDGHVDVPVIIAYIFASLSVSISYVLQVHPVRRSLVSLIWGSRVLDGAKEKSIRIGLVTTIMLASYGFAVGIGKNLSLPINVAGLLGGNTMCFVMPFMLFMQYHGWSWRKGEGLDWMKISVTAVLIICLALYPICLTGIIHEAVKK